MSVRPALPGDLPRMLAIYGPYIENTTYSFEYTVPTPEEFAARFAGITARYPWLVWEEDGTVLGYAYASPLHERAAYQWSADVSIYLDPSAHRKGIGRALYTALEEILVSLGYFNTIAIITEENSISRRFHESMGYVRQMDLEQVGYKFGRWLNVSYYKKRLREGIPEMSPRPWNPAE